MNTRHRFARRSLSLLGAAVMFAGGCAGLPTSRTTTTTSLTGNQEVPPVATNASGVTDIAVEPSKCPAAASSADCPTLFGSVTTSGMRGTRAEIRQGDAGQNGPVIARLVQVNDHTWAVPTDTTLTDAQYRAYWAGHFYVDVASAASPNGEIRGQLMR